MSATPDLGRSTGDAEIDAAIVRGVIGLEVARPGRALAVPALLRQALIDALLDWAVVVAYLVWIVWDGLRRSKATNEVEGYFLANRSLPWWAVGLSVMATQLSRHHAGRHDGPGVRRRA